MIARAPVTRNGLHGDHDAEGVGDSEKVDMLGDLKKEEIHPLAPLLDALGVLGREAGNYLAASSDALALRIRRLLIWAIVGCVGAIVGTAALVVSVSLVLHGIADGLGVLWAPWAGDLLTGFVVLSAVAVLFYFGIKRDRTAYSRRLRSKHECRRHQDRVHAGRSSPAAHECRCGEGSHG